MADEPLFPPLDPVADLQATLTFGEARQALALCLQFFLVSSAVEFGELREAIDMVVEQHPHLSEPLRLLYRRINEECEERLLFFDAVEEWASSQDTALRAVAIEPQQWHVILRAGADSLSVDVERGWDVETDEMTIIITTPDGEKVEN